ncbi:unnamed protein product [Cyprideis torosa]|uniref:Uncharacterized protein n=1 Tax=Cyprideis torosa TaxID=163714 RepID=A0A7R8W7H2_9CRUS|nr:unnamed protein product [Cyprideis torosa]CAG0882180.1 unnamed protein product [Cyprideis torosa]
MADSQEQPERQTGGGAQPTERRRGWNVLVQHVTEHKIETGLWATRLLTISFTLGYFIPLFGNPYNLYYKVLMSNAATSALRLHQRSPTLQLSREFFGLLFLEDSCHYLIYSLLFLTLSPATIIVMPVALYALLHFASYSLTLLDCLGLDAWWGARFLISIVDFQTRNILRLIAFSEILVMPMLLLMIFSGRASVFSPFLYYRFLSLRYASRRNPHTRTMFHELRMRFEAMVLEPRCPEFVRNMVLRTIAFISNLAPVIPPPS